MIKITHTLQSEKFKGKKTNTIINPYMIESIRYSYNEFDLDTIFMKSNQTFFINRKQTLKIEEELIK